MGAKVSVVIPTYKRPAELKRAINSVLRQSYAELEVLIVRDGLDDVTREAVACFADSRIRLIALDEKVGGAEARNIGVRAAVGEWIALLDDDDEWLPEKLAQQIALAQQQSGSNYVVATRYVYARPGQKTQIWPGHLPRRGEHLSEFLFASRGGFQTSVYLVPRSLFLAKPFTAGLKKHQDWDWFLRLASDPNFKVVWCDEPLSIYWAPQKQGSSVSTSQDWTWSASWAKQNLPLMTRRAYAMFLVRICLRGAAEAAASPREVLALLRELLLVGNADARLWIEAGAALLLPKASRQALSAWVAPLRQART